MSNEHNEEDDCDLGVFSIITLNTKHIFTVKNYLNVHSNILDPCIMHLLQLYISFVHPYVDYML